MKPQGDREKEGEFEDVEILDTLPADPPRPLTPFQKQAAVFLASNGYTYGVRSPRNLVARAALLVGYSRDAIYDWLKLPEFMQLIERIQAEGDAHASDGWWLLMRGDEERGIKPEIAACIAWKKSRNPEVFDEHYRRDQAKRKHEREMFEMKCRYEKEMAEQKHRHEMEMLDKRLSNGLPPEDEREIPGFNLRVTAQGERIDPKDRDDDTH